MLLRRSETTHGKRRQPRDVLGSVRELPTPTQRRRAADDWLARSPSAAIASGPGARFRSIAERFLRDVASTWRPTSRDRFAQIVRRHLLPVFGGLAPGAIRVPEVRKFLAKLHERGLQPATIRSIRGALLRLLREAADEGHAVVPIEPARIPLPRRTKPMQEARAFSAREIRELIAAAEPAALRAMLALGGYQGLRIAEVLALRWGAIDFRANTLTISDSVVRRRVQECKTATSRATIPLTAEAREVLLAYRRVAPSHPGGFLFPTRTGRPQSADNLRRRWLQPLLERLGIPKAGWHALRHGCAFALVQAGVSLPAAQRFMRHATPAETARYAAHAGALDLAAELNAGRKRATEARAAP